MFDTWMADLVFDEQSQEVEIDEDEVQNDEVQIVDTSTLILKEASESYQLVLATKIEAQDMDMIYEKSKVRVMMSVQDKES